MESMVKTYKSADGLGFAEEATITVDGHNFTSGGASFHPDHGGTLYVSDDKGESDRWGWRLAKVTTWEGTYMGEACARAFHNNFGGKTDSITAWIKGRKYYGRKSHDWSDAINLRPCKTR